MTENANPTLGRIEDLFQSLVWDNLVNAALASLFAYVPFLNIWGVRQIVSFLVRRYTSELFGALRLVLDLGVIQFVNDGARKSFDSASFKLHVIALEKGINSDEYRKAKDDAKTALAQFVRFNGS